MSRRMFLCLGCLVYVGFALPAAGEAPPSDTTRNEKTADIIVEFHEAKHFTAPDNSDLVVRSGVYRVAAGQGAQLQLSPQDGVNPILITAQTFEHNFDLASPVALIIPRDEDRQHLVLLQPGGKALDAVGSASGVGTRGPIQPIPTDLLAQALSAKVSPSSALRPGGIDLSKTRIPLNLVIQPTAPTSLFQDCGAAQSGGYLDTVYTSQVNTGAPYNPNIDNAPGTPFIRMTAAPRKEFRCAIGAVTVKATAGNWGAGDQLQLRIVSYVYGYGAWVRDRYQQAPASNTPLKFPDVIMATFDMGNDPNQFLQHENVAAKSLSTGYLLGVEVFLNGGVAAKVPCVLKVQPGGAATLDCAPSHPYPPGM